MTKKPFQPGFARCLVGLAMMSVFAGCQDGGPASQVELREVTDRAARPVSIHLGDLLAKPTPGMEVSGEPERVEDAALGEVVRFDGVDDSIYIDRNPLEGLTRFTVEIIFRQDAGASNEPRFFHIGHAKGDRMLLETRITDDGRWYLDSFLRSGENYKVLIDPEQNHPIGEWAHAALVLEDGQMRHYVNGRLELEGHIDFQPITGGGMRLGARMNQKHFFKGAIHSIRVTPEALVPENFEISSVPQ